MLTINLASMTFFKELIVKFGRDEERFEIFIELEIYLKLRTKSKTNLIVYSIFLTMS